MIHLALALLLQADDHGNDAAHATRVALGARTAGTIDELPDSFDEDWFALDAVEGGDYTFTVRLGTLADSVLALHAPDGAVVRTNDDARGDLARGSLIEWSCTAAGTYNLRVSAYLDYAGTYTLEIDGDVPTPSPPDTEHPTGPPPEAREIAVGQEAQGELTPQGWQQFWAFNADAGQGYTVTVRLGTLGDSLLELRDAQDNGLAANDDGEGDLGRGSRIEWGCPTAGRYLLVVSAIGDPYGTYTIRVDPGTATPVVPPAAEGDEVPDAREQARPIEIGADAAAGIQTGDPGDFFSFQAEAGRGYVLIVRLGTLGDSTLELQDGEGRTLSSNDDAGGDLGRGSKVEWTCPAAGRYFAVVRAYSSGTGSYTLRIDLGTATPIVPPAQGDEVPDTREQARPIDVGTEASAGIQAGDGGDFFALQAEVGRGYVLTVRLGTLSDSVLELQDGGGRTLVVNDDAGGDLGRGSRIDWPCPAAGRYFALVRGLGSSTGSYTFAVTPAAAVAVAGRPIALGQEIEGSVAARAEDRWVFDAEAGRGYVITVQLGTLADSILVLRSPADQEITRNDDIDSSNRGSRLRWTCPATGRYLVIVAGFSDASGTYRLRVEPGTAIVLIPPMVERDEDGGDLGSARPLAPGSEVMGGIQAAGDVDVFAFNAEARRAYALTVRLGTLEDSTLELVTSERNTVTSNDDAGGELGNGSQINWTCDATGRYYLFVKGYGGRTGSYAVCAEEAAAPEGPIDRATPIGVGETVQGSIDANGEEDLYMVPVEAGVDYRATVRLAGLSDSVLAARDAAGNVLAENDDASSEDRGSMVEFKPRAAGHVFLIVRGYAAATGAYEIRVERR